MSTDFTRSEVTESFFLMSRRIGCGLLFAVVLVEDARGGSSAAPIFGQAVLSMK